MNSYVTICIAQDGIFLGNFGILFFSHVFLGTTTFAGEVGPTCSRGLGSQQIKLQMFMSQSFYVLIWNICLFL